MAGSSYIVDIGNPTNKKKHKLMIVLARSQSRYQPKRRKTNNSAMFPSAQSNKSHSCALTGMLVRI